MQKEKYGRRCPSRCVNTDANFCQSIVASQSSQSWWRINLGNPRWGTMIAVNDASNDAGRRKLAESAAESSWSRCWRMSLFVLRSRFTRLTRMRWIKIMRGEMTRVVNVNLIWAKDLLGLFPAIAQVTISWKFLFFSCFSSDDHSR